jgi:hypothetical protein
MYSNKDAGAQQAAYSTAAPNQASSPYSEASESPANYPASSVRTASGDFGYSPGSAYR